MLFYIVKRGENLSLGKWISSLFLEGIQDTIEVGSLLFSRTLGCDRLSYADIGRRTLVEEVVGVICVSR